MRVKERANKMNNLEYDRKFDQMKSYIPFLEDMIRRLESTSSSSNPRQAQLNKIRSLRDLLLDKKKRMKMDNLLKCEQVLVNLYAKVEQINTLPGCVGPSHLPSDPLFPTAATVSKDNPNLDSVRNKLKTVSKTLTDDTLDIAKASETEEGCIPGSKEPALFQRRPNKASISPSRGSPNITSTLGVSKRNYTRVLISPEPSRRWSKNTNLSPNKPLFSRRSPRRSPKRVSPSYSKKDKKKMSKQSHSKGLNITLKVPEDCLPSLNTEDILSRIINCSDSDVDIDTLRDLRKQIIGELNNTGTKNDISDLILKSYKKKKKKVKSKEEIEEGEISDSESEAIESIYGSLVVFDKEKPIDHDINKAEHKEMQQQKIQICLVINSEKDKEDVHIKASAKDSETSDFEMFDVPGISTVNVNASNSDEIKKRESTDIKEAHENPPKYANLLTKIEERKGKSDIITIDDDDVPKDTTQTKTKISVISSIKPASIIDLCNNSETEKLDAIEKEENTFKANFYNEQVTEADTLSKRTDKLQTHTIKHIKNTTEETKEPTYTEKIIGETKNTPQVPSTESSKIVKSDKHIFQELKVTEIPLLNLDPVDLEPTKKDKVSEIDILQALKNEILSESINIPGTEEATPALHQPKITKVSSAQEIRTKKRISIESYKQKTTPQSKNLVYINHRNIRKMNEEENAKKQSLKLTEKECERFNFEALAFDSSDEEVEVTSCHDVSDVLAPKSPENEDFVEEVTTPIIIPVDPIKTTDVANANADTDMRTLFSPMPVSTPIVSPSIRTENKSETRRHLLADPRVRREVNKNNVDSPNPHSSTSVSNFGGVVPSMAPNMTPNARTFEMTPSRQAFDIDDKPTGKHVYAPVFSINDSREISSYNDASGPRWELNNEHNEHREERKNHNWDTYEQRSKRRDLNADCQNVKYKDGDRYSQEPRNDRYHLDGTDELYHRRERNQPSNYSFGSPSTPTPSFGRQDVPKSSVHPFKRNESLLPITSHPYERGDCPTTPNHPFGRGDCPTTPSHPFGRGDCPTTPSHSFGRGDCPTTPSHPFGRGECPTTPTHSFGRLDCPLTPSHPFGRLECPTTPNHPFGRSDVGGAPKQRFSRSDYHQNQLKASQKFVNDPRLNRSTDYESNCRKFGDRDYGKRKSDYTYRHNNESSRNYDREQSIGRNEGHKSSTQGGYLNTDQKQRRRESSIGRFVSRDCHETRLTTDRTVVHKDDFHQDKDYSKNMHHKNENYQKYQYLQRGQSAGRKIQEGNYNSSSRAPSLAKIYQEKCTDDKRLSVNPQSERSFTIDTSVNTTFQKFLNEKGMQVLDNSFDARRKRASSVGRTIVPSVKRTVPEESIGLILSTTKASAEDTSGYKSMINFVRARSVGRDMASYEKTDRSFKDIKADFQSYSASYAYTEKPKSNPIRKEIHEFHQGASYYHAKSVYSPRKNNRDPRNRRDPAHSFKNRYEDKKKNYGMVYSHENIAKGVILGSGYGVKNYKIPKIKRPETETDNKDKVREDKKIERSTSRDIVIKSSNNKNEGKERTLIAKGNKAKVGKSDIKKKKTYETDIKMVGQIAKNKEIQTNNYKPDNKSSKVKIISNPESENKESDLEDTVVKPRKPKKTIIDSDSEEELLKTKQIDVSKVIDQHIFDDKAPIKAIVSNKKPMDDLENSFGVDELEIFPENLESDNINALIANLDYDIDLSKSDENIFDDILNSSKDLSVEEPSNIISKFGTYEGILEVKSKIQDLALCQLPVEIGENTKDTKSGQPSEPTALNYFNKIDSHNLDLSKGHLESPKKQLQDDKNEALTISEQKTFKNVFKNDENICTTTNIEKETEERLENPIDDQQDKFRSTPDSTINEVPGESSADVNSSNTVSYNPLKGGSTNEVQGETSSDVTSTFEQNETANECTEPSTLNKDSATQKESVDCLLSILQDKSKILELLSMLGEKTSENEKIKKTLSKLVSDDGDEESNDILGQNNQNEESGITNDASQSPTKITTSEKAENSDHIEETDSNLKTITSKSIQVGADNSNTDPKTKANKPRNRKTIKKTKSRKGKKVVSAKRITRSGAATTKGTLKGARELRQLQNDIKEMFLSDDVINATGIRMCRLAKLVSEKQPNLDEEKHTIPNEIKPVVVLEKYSNKELSQDSLVPIKKKPGPKPKTKLCNVNKSAYVENKSEHSKSSPKYKPGPKSKTKPPAPQEVDPYSFDNDSNVTSEKTELSSNRTSSDSDSESLASSQSCGSSEVLADLKKKTKRKRRSGWKSGVIKTSKRKKKEFKQAESEVKQVESDTDKKERKLSVNEDTLLQQRLFTIPDMNCFTDKFYCFSNNSFTYSCRLCEYSGSDIVRHYKKHHPHSEIPLSRMSPAVAKEAIEQCEEINFQVISKMSTDKYICRFCFTEFSNKRTILETFFWHVVSVHTGEYKQLCSECINVTRCPFNLDIPPPPKDLKGQLIGYICGKCNFTQISLENLKTHVIVRHNDEQTEVYTINLAAMTKKTIKALMKRCELMTDEPRVLRSSHSNQSVADASDDRSSEITEITQPTSSDQESIQHIIEKSIESLATKTISKRASISALENSAIVGGQSNIEKSITAMKVKIEDKKAENQVISTHPNEVAKSCDKHLELDIPTRTYPSSDIVDYPHFKICYTDSGAKEYVCCINRTDNHYKTSLLISMKRHVQTKHSETWDGYCCLCKLIVTTQGVHLYKECLQHFLDRHMDEFPVLEQSPELDIPISAPVQISNSSTVLKDTFSEIVSSLAKETHTKRTSSPKPYINVRPLTLLQTEPVASADQEETDAFPKIQSITSIGPVEQSLLSLAYPPGTTSLNDTISSTTKDNENKIQKLDAPIKYEETQAEVMSKKHRAVLDSMMPPSKLIKIYKCAGRFCSFATDSADAALLHASAHQRIGGENALACTYCNFDCSGNAIDLVMHIFKSHGRCKYACKFCFYRASASQLVHAHATRIHGKSGAVLETTNIIPATEEPNDVLNREIAVKHYVCVDNNCKFRSYTQGKFVEHLEKHEPPYLCGICELIIDEPAEMILHMKLHGLKLYQCSRCVHGADNEAELLAHASARHPDKIPSAYLRIIKSKDGHGKLTVLPLAQLNTSKIATETVTQEAIHSDPVREAERSIDLEKLIGLIDLPISEVETNFAERDDEQAIQTHETLLASTIEAEITLNPPRLITPPPSTLVDEEMSRLTPILKPVVKTEPEDETPTKEVPISDVVCLDTDEEDSGDVNKTASTDTPSMNKTQNIIDLSEDDPVTVHLDLKYKKIPIAMLFQCPKCPSISKNLKCFKIHTQNHIRNVTNIQCPHCPFIVKDKINLFNHYVFDHGEDRRSKSARYKCGICDFMHVFQSTVKNHLRVSHGVTSYLVGSTFTVNGVVEYTLSESPTVSKIEPKLSSKRKFSDTNLSPSPKKTRFSPQELDKLPQKPILDELAYCSECEFNTKVRLNLVRHLQLHADKQAVPHTVPVNPVPHLETNEKHFDKMINLASSSVVTRAPDKQERTAAVSLLIPPETASRFPKYVPERQRNTCGAKGCSYTSVDEAMLKRHWETLHNGSTEYHCVHCPQRQKVDTSKPLTSARIIGHLKMHDVRLYACSICHYYHFKKLIVEKHLAESHKNGRLLVVREEVMQAPGPSQVLNTPTMDLKPWQCGLCKFKSMQLRPEVIEHYKTEHHDNPKMQYKCPNCPYRASTLENVLKHKTKSHPESDEEIFYYYYREGSIPDEADGTTRWQKQRLKMGEPEVKTELSDISASNAMPLAPILAAPVLDLNIVKKEIEVSSDSIEELCKLFGSFCGPIGMQFKCPLCNTVTEESRDVMQSHLFEELQYRKWGCNICSYKAFHRTGLNEHAITEHRLRMIEPIELPLNDRVEKWVKHLLQHQENMINGNREILTKAVKPTATVSKTPHEYVADNMPEINDLIKAFGHLGTPKEKNFRCPKCQTAYTSEGNFKDHLEIELNKIRWRCSKCFVHSQNYHEAQLHCKTCKGEGFEAARPVEAIRDPAVRVAWVATVIREQKLAMKNTTANQEQELMETTKKPPKCLDDLLVVRYEETVPTPEEEMLNRRKRPAPSPNTTQAATLDSDDERLIIDELDEEKEPKEPSKKIKKLGWKNCKFCNFTTRYSQAINDHILRHYRLRPYSCKHCNHTNYKYQIEKHLKTAHPDLEPSFTKTCIPAGDPLDFVVTTRGRKPSNDTEKDPSYTPSKQSSQQTLICLICEQSVAETETYTHTHNRMLVQFARKGDVIIKCLDCLSLLANLSDMAEHHNKYHPNSGPPNYSFYKMHHDRRFLHYCDHCNQSFKFLRLLKAHHVSTHSDLPLKYDVRPATPGDLVTMCEEDVITELNSSAEKKTESTPFKRVAKKSTTKLPSQTVAKKSTTKLPLYPDMNTDTEYSFYGTKPTPSDELDNVTTIMPFCNSMMPFTVKKLSEIIQIEPTVLVEDIKKINNQ